MDTPGTPSGATATDILYNAHALHALKRDQLLKLCKAHGLKSSGNKADLVAALQFHARALAATADPDNLTAIQPTVPEDDEDDTPLLRRSPRRSPRKHTQGKPTGSGTVMDALGEAEESDSLRESTIASMRSGVTGELGTNGSKGSGISNSLKSFASSLGLKRTPNQRIFSPAPALSPSDPKSAKPPTPAPPPSTDEGHSIPGAASRPGAPAPDEVDARLSLGAGVGGAGPSTTVRLVASSSSLANKGAGTADSVPVLRAFTTAFDLDLEDENEVQKLYPDLFDEDAQEEGDEEDMPGAYSAAAVEALLSDHNSDTDMPGGFASSSPSDKDDQPAEEADTPRPIMSSKAPYVFGSPSPPASATKAGFSNAADSILAEMNRRLLDAGGTVLSPSALKRPLAPLPGSVMDGLRVSEDDDRFGKTHNNLFNRMESIRDAVEKREGKKRGSEAIVPTRPKATTSKRVRVAEGAAAGPSITRVDEQEEDEEAARRHEKEREAIRRRLALNSARRRSERASGAHTSRRSSLTKGKSPQKADAKKGLLASARSLMKSVWNRGPGTSKTPLSAPAFRSAEAASASPAKKETTHDEVKDGHMANQAKKPALLPKSGAIQAMTRKTVLASKRATSSTTATTAGTSKQLAIAPTAPNKKSIVSKATVGSSTTSSRASSTTTTSRPGAVPGAATSLGARARPSAPAPVGLAASRKSMVPTIGHVRAGGTTSAAPLKRPSQLRTASTGSVSSLGGGRTPPLPSVASLASVGEESPVKAANSASKKSASGPTQSGLKLNKQPTSAPSSSKTASTTIPTTVKPAAKPTPTTNAEKRPAAASRLFTPTAASLAKARPSAVQGPRPSPTKHQAGTPRLVALEQVTNSPRPRTIFTKPLSLGSDSSPSKIPQSSVAPSAFKPGSGGTGANKPSALPVRKPRISRSRVIAKLGEKRAAGAPSEPAPVPRAVSGTAPKVAKAPGLRTVSSYRVPSGRVRSSLGAQDRRSFGGTKTVDAARVAAQKQVRQSEMASRKSVVKPAVMKDGMDVD